MSLTLRTKYLEGFVADHEFDAIAPAVTAAHNTLAAKNGPGNDFLGWVELPTDYDKEEFARIKAAAEKIKDTADVLIVIGIGGSYLGARAAIELLKSPFYNNLKKDTPDIYFVGNNISATYLNEVLSICEGKDVAVNVISKSGTTTEPALAFRVFKKLLEDKYGKDGAKERIFATTDKAKGTLKELSDEMGYETFVVPDDVGGRFSVLTAVGLLPIAVAGCDIDALMKGAQNAQKKYANDDGNDCYKYAAARNILYRKGKSVEMLVSYDPAFTLMGEWYKQLFGESEGKEGKGLFPASLTFSTDLHSMGQFLQEGSQVFFETIFNVLKRDKDVTVPASAGADLAGKSLNEINAMAVRGVMAAHAKADIQMIKLDIDEISEYGLGQLLYFLMMTSAVTGKLMGIDPFNQPGVEDYKQEIRNLLGQ